MRYVAFLRGINLGGRRVTGEQLCVPFEELGFEHVSSFLASGNVIFDTDPVDHLEAVIETALQEALGYPVETFVRTADEVSEIVAHSPFAAEVVAASAGKAQVTFLRRAPAPAERDAVLALATEDDRLAISSREWHWLPSGGISQSSLDVRAIERVLGRGTTRTRGTVTRLHAKLLVDPSS
jgi:uncharacterized protein (DUF1697 family)